MNITFDEFVAGIQRRAQIIRDTQIYEHSITTDFFSAPVIDKTGPDPDTDPGDRSGPEEY